MNILITGCNGQLGRAVRKEYAGEKVTFINTDVTEGEGVLALDITDVDAVMELVRREKPDVIISSGAAVAVPFFYLGKLMGKKLIYIEVFDRIDKPTVTGKMVYPITDRFIVQWEEMKKVYPKAINLGSIF